MHLKSLTLLAAAFVGTASAVAVPAPDPVAAPEPNAAADPQPAAASSSSSVPFPYEGSTAFVRDDCGLEFHIKGQTCDGHTDPIMEKTGNTCTKKKDSSGAPFDVEPNVCGSAKAEITWVNHAPGEAKMDVTWSNPAGYWMSFKFDVRDNGDSFTVDPNSGSPIKADRGEHDL